MKFYDRETEHLKANAVCDRCPARAFGFAVFSDDHSLRFCGHHFGQYVEALKRVARFVVDERHRIPGVRNYHRDTVSA